MSAASPASAVNPFPLRHRTAFALSAADPAYIFDLAQVSTHTPHARTHTHRLHILLVSFD